MRATPITILALTLAACQPQGEGTIQPKNPDPSGTATGTTLPTTTTTTDTGTLTTTGTGTTTTVTYDCSVLPTVPVSFVELTGFSTAEDFDIDGDGFAGSIYSGSLTGRDQAGNIKLISPNVAPFSAAGTRVLGTGDWVVATTGEVVLVDAITGGKTTLMGSFSYPNGVEVDQYDNVYVADQNNGTLTRVNAYNPSDFEIIASGMSNPNGVIMTVDEQTIYVGSFGGGVVYGIQRNAAGTGWEAPVVVFQSPGWDNGFDGINVDICGNIYFTEWIVGKIRRISADWQQVDLVAEVPSTWIPNLRWGNDVGGWDNDVLYVSDRDQGRIFGLDIGLPGKPPLVP